MPPTDLKDFANKSDAPRARRYRNHAAFFQSERGASPFNLIHAEAGHPHKKRKQVAHRQ
jgi:hypothetical protein